MTCPVCGEPTTVIDTASDIDVVMRKRKCVKCGYKFFTEECESADKDITQKFGKIRRKSHTSSH